MGLGGKMRWMRFLYKSIMSDEILSIPSMKSNFINEVEYDQIMHI